MVNKYYQKHKENFKKVARERYQNLSKEKKDQKRPETDINLSIIMNVLIRIF